MVGRVLNNRYQMEQLLGTGGMADVYLATDTLLGRHVAVKILHPQYAKDPVFIQRFRQEAQAAANLNHRNIVNVYDWGTDEGLDYLVMEHVEGSNLKDIILGGGPLLPERAVEIAVAICSALEAAHANGIVHRDIKPQNIIVMPDNQIKVMDFGIARAAGGSAMTQTGTILGTAQYISPEQAQGRTADPRSDLYSLGIVIYEMLTGKVPFDGESPVSIAYKHVREDPLPPAMMNPDISPELEAVVMKALAKNPENRYQNAQEMQADLERCLEGAPVYATPVLSREEAARGATQVYPAARPAAGRRSRTWLWILIIVIVLAAAGGGAFALIKSASGTKVPDLVGKTTTEAEKVLKDSGLELVIAKKVIDPERPKDVIISQDPQAGSKISKGGTVEVVVSKGRELVAVPDCRGLTLERARALIGEANLKVGDVTQEFSASVPQGKVSSQSPEPGAKESVGATVDLAISKGAEMVVVPSVVGMTKDAATKSLEAAGFKAEVQEVSSTQPEGNVIDQNPAAGQRAAKGSKVVISVAKKIELVTVPTVIGASQNTAETTLTNAGLKASVVERPTTIPAEVGFVLDQDPPAGTNAEKGSTVKIFVGVSSSPP